jgi:hypothetical protein
MTSNQHRTSHPSDVRFAERDLHLDVVIRALQTET